MKNYLANYNLFAVSANLEETAINTEQTLDTSLLISRSDVIDVEQRREDNSNELTGKEEPDTTYDLGATLSKTLNFEKAQAQHFGLAYSYALGVSTPAAWGTGYKHAITPTSAMSLPGFTGAMRLGKTIMKRRFASLFIDTVTATFAKDSWAKLGIGIKGTGKYTDNLAKATIAAAYNATSLTMSLAVSSIARSGTTATVTTTKEHCLSAGMGITIAGATETNYNVSTTILAVLSKTQFTYTVANSPTTPATGTPVANFAVVGPDAAARLDSVHRIRAKAPTTNEWVEVSFSAVSGATPAVITISAPGGVATLCDYEILYVPSEAAWCTFPARVTEPPLRVSDLVMKIGGKWDGSAFQGGRTISDEIESVEHSLNNQMLVEFRPGGTGGYANYAIRGGRVQTLKLDRQMREFVLQQAIKDNEYFGVSLKATGAEFESGKNYYVELVFPRVNVIKSPIKVNDKILGEEGDLKIMEDDTYGSVLCWVGNKVSGYAQ